MPEDFLEPFIDLIVMGEGVFVFRDVVRKLEKGEELKGIQGIAYVKDGKMVMTPFNFVVDLDLFPFPERRLTERYRRHYFTEWMKPLASIRTSKGCPFRCNFCAFLLKRSNQILNQIRNAYRDYNRH